MIKRNYIHILGNIAIGCIILAAASCKEQGKLQIIADAEEETYISDTIPEPQTKRILVDEMSGVDCVACPAGAKWLDEVNKENSGLLEIVAVHAGFMTTPFAESRQDFRMEEAKRRAYLAIMGNPGKPCAAFDRLALNSGQNKYMTEGYTRWPASLATAQQTTTTPLNIDLKTSFNSEQNRYDIEVTVRYTQEVENQQAIHIYLTESKMIDIQNTPENNRAEYEFNHVLRDVLTPMDGKPFLTDIAKKEPGRVYIYKTNFSIDDTHELQKNWKPENMTVVAFVSAYDPDDIHVYHVQSKKLL